MRIARFESSGHTGIARVEDDTLVVLDAPDVVTACVSSASETGDRLSMADVRLLAPVPKPPKFLAIALNYQDHIDETGATAPDFPTFFNKQTSCVTGPYDPIVVPSVSSFVDYEGELGVVIGRVGRRVSEDEAESIIAGYLVVNDVSARDWQFKAPTHTHGKSFDTHGPIGPWVVTPDEVGDPHALGIRTWVNGDLLQDGSTKDMIFDVWHQLSVLTTACTLEPGDLLATGTPAGVGVARKPTVQLKDGDTVRIEIEGIGSIENPVVTD